MHFLSFIFDNIFEDTVKNKTQKVHIFGSVI